jgi:hypothetical protein
MSLVLGLRVGEDVFVDDERLVMVRVDSEQQTVIERTADGQQFKVVIGQNVEVIPGVRMAMGDRSTTKMARISIEAPRTRKILTGVRYREETVHPERAKAPETRVAYQVSRKAIAQAERLGIIGDGGSLRIKLMAQKSAPFTHERFNRRYQQHILLVQNDIVTDIAILSPQERAFYNSRRFEERLAEEDPGEAEVIWKDGRERGR